MKNLEKRCWIIYESAVESTVENELWLVIMRYLGYAWAAGRFCKGCLKTTSQKEALPAALLRADWEKKLLAASMILALIMLAENFIESFLSCQMLIWMHTVWKIQEPFLTERMMEMSVSIRVALVIFLLCGITKRAASIFHGKPRKWYVMLAVPLLLLTLVMMFVNWGAGHGILVRGAEEMSLYYDQLFSHLYIMLLSALSMFAAVSYVTGMSRLYVEQQRNGQYHAQVAAYKMLDEQYRQAERLRHDMKNHLIALTGLLEERAWEKMRTYLQKMENSGCLESGSDVTGNKVVDALLYRKRKAAEEKRILWECDAQLSGLDSIDEFDLCVLFGNILDNAVEACDRLEEGRERFIHIQAKIIKRYFLLEVKNSADVEEKGKQKDGDKEKAGKKIMHEKNGHGIGTLNIRDMVQRCHGVVDWKIGEGVYGISVLLPLEEKEDLG